MLLIPLALAEWSMTPNMAIVPWRRWTWLELSTSVYSLFQMYALASNCCLTTATKQLIIGTWLHKVCIRPTAPTKISAEMSIRHHRKLLYTSLITINMNFACHAPLTDNFVSWLCMVSLLLFVTDSSCMFWVICRLVSCALLHTWQWNCTCIMIICHFILLNIAFISRKTERIIYYK